MGKETFVTVVSCMDGRIQKPLREFATQRFQVDHADTITDRGGLLRHLAEEDNADYVDNMMEDIQVSLKAHNSKGVVIAGHESCAGYPIPDDQKKREVVHAAGLIRSSAPGVEVIPVFVRKSEPQWEVEVLE